MNIIFNYHIVSGYYFQYFNKSPVTFYLTFIYLFIYACIYLLDIKSKNYKTHLNEMALHNNKENIDYISHRLVKLKVLPPITGQVLRYCGI